MCLRGAGGEDSPDSRALGKQRPATGRSAGGPGAARGWRLWRILFRTVNLEPTQTAYWKPEPEKDIKSPLIYCVCVYILSHGKGFICTFRCLGTKGLCGLHSSCTASQLSQCVVLRTQLIFIMCKISRLKEVHFVLSSLLTTPSHLCVLSNTSW